MYDDQIAVYSMLLYHFVSAYDLLFPTFDHTNCISFTYLYSLPDVLDILAQNAFIRRFSFDTFHTGKAAPESHRISLNRLPSAEPRSIFCYSNYNDTPYFCQCSPMFLVFISYQFNYFSQFLYFLSLYGFPTSLPRLQVYFHSILSPSLGL